jgi:outer membrane protein insertion porin family
MRKNMNFFKNGPAANLLAAICMIAAFALPYTLAAQEEQVVRKIELRGLSAHSEDEILSKMQTKVGKPFSRDVIQGDIVRLDETGYFSDIQTATEPFEGGMAVIFMLKENTVVRDVVFNGLKRFSDRVLLADVKLRPGDLFNSFKLQTDATMIRDKYLNDGYYFVAVDSGAREVPSGVVVEHNVREGPRVTVEEISFTGNKSMEKGDLMDNVLTGENGWFSSAPYVHSKVLDDVQRIMYRYRSEGWLDADTSVEEVKFSEDKEDVFITIHIEEGVRYYVKSFSLVGPKMFDSAYLLSKLQMKEGQPYTSKLLDKDRQAIKFIYGEKAYIDAELVVRTQYTSTPGEVMLTYEINEGSKVYLEKVRVIGNAKTKDKVIRRHVRVYPGDEINLKEVERSRDRLEASRYFENVDFRFESTDNPDAKNLVIEVQEGTTGNFRFGGGYSSGYGIVGLVELTIRNFDIADWPKSFQDIIDGTAFVGAGQNFKAYAQPGGKRSSYGVSFREPYLADMPLGLDVGGFMYSRTREAYDEDRTGGNLGVDRRFEDQGLSFGLGFRYENIDISNVDRHDAPWIVLEQEGDNDLLALTPNVTWDRRNSQMLPSEGYRLRFSYTFAGNFMGGDFDFSKAFFDAEYFTTLYMTDTGARHILSFEQRFGWAEPNGDSDDTPIFERFYAGGVSTVRGFENRTIGPRVDDYPVGGDATLVSNIEYSFPIYRTEISDRYADIIRLAFFTDIGTVTEELGDMHGSSFRSAAGFGFRFNVPQLGNVPISLDFGFPIDKEDGDDTQVIGLNIGYFY